MQRRSALKTGRSYISIAVLTAAVCLIVLGVMRGELYTAFVKAVRICLECIGLG